MLKEFRSIDVYWDKATRRIYEEIRSSSSDEKGRKLTVQIVNDGQIQDLTNVALNLYWETQDGENRGLDPFEPLDAENGIYELYFRTGMLEHVGKLNAHLHLVDTTGAITSEPFTIVVFEGVDVDAMASEDELSALTQALVQVNNLETTYAPRLNAVEGSVDSLTDDAALNKSNIVSNTQDIVNLDGRLTTVEQNIDEHLAETASDDVHGLKPVLLFEGNVWETGTIINLADNKQNYSRLDFLVDFSGIETRTVYHKDNPTHVLKSINLSDSGESTVLVAFEMLLEQPSDTTFKIRHNFRWSWTGSSGSNATINPTSNNAVTIYRIYGYK